MGSEASRVGSHQAGDSRGLLGAGIVETEGRAPWEGWGHEGAEPTPTATAFSGQKVPSAMIHSFLFLS